MFKGETGNVWGGMCIDVSVRKKGKDEQVNGSHKLKKKTSTSIRITTYIKSAFRCLTKSRIIMESEI